MMWNFASSCIAGSVGLKNDLLKPTQDSIDCSDDEVSSVTSREEGLECPICWESFNLVENIPYVLWCGHTLCKNCILGLQWAVVKCPTLPLQLPLFISCPWCNLMSLRLVYRGNLKFPRKNFFLLWMLESMNGDRVKSHSTICGDHQVVWPSSTKAPRSYTGNNLRRGPHIHHSEPSGSSHVEHYFNSYLAIERLHSTFKKSLIFFVHLTAKFPLVIIFLLIIFLCSFDSQVSTGHHFSSVCNTCQCSHLGTVHTHYSSLCTSIFPHSVLCISQFGLASEGDHHLTFCLSSAAFHLFTR